MTVLHSERTSYSLLCVTPRALCEQALICCALALVSILRLCYHY